MDATVCAIEQRMLIKTSGMGTAYDANENRWTMNDEAVSLLGALLWQQQPPAPRSGAPWHEVPAQALKTSADWVQGLIVGLDSQGSWEDAFIAPTDFGLGLGTGLRIRRWLQTAGAPAPMSRA
jgi:hypothetical protein